MEKRFDEKIEQAERKFLSVFKEHRLDNKKLDLTPFVESDNEKSFSLNALLEMDQSLMNDPHFLEMFRDVNKYCSEDYSKRAQTIDKIYVFLGGLLKVLLRECVSVYQDHFLRKEMVEKTYQWYRDKRRKLLEFRLSQTVNNGNTSENSNNANENNQTNSSTEYAIMEEQKIPNSRATSSLSQRSDLSNNNVGHRLDPRVITFDVLSVPSNDPTTPFYASDEKKRKAFINHKLKQYCRRNLSKSYDNRKNGVYLNKEIEIKNFDVATSSISSGSTNASSNSGRTSQLSSLLFKKPKDLIAFYGEEEKKVGNYDNAMKHWLNHRAKEAEEKIEDLEFKDAILAWRINRSRIEEEMQRRQESQTFASQTGIRVHKVKNYKLPTIMKRQNLLDDSSEDEEMKIEAKSKLRFNSSEVSLKSPSRTGSSLSKPIKNQKPIPEEESDSGESFVEPENVFLSPYNNDLLEETFAAKKERERLEEEMVREPDASSKGFVTPTSSIKPNVPLSTAKFFVTELNSTPRYTFSRPSTSVNTPVTVDNTRPKTTNNLLTKSNQSMDTYSRSSIMNGKLTSASLSSSNHKVVSHNVFELYQKQQAEKKNEQKRKKPPQKKGNTNSRSKPTNRPSSARSTASNTQKPNNVPSKEEGQLGFPPSIRRNIEMEQCEKLKVLLSKEEVIVPASVIQKVMITPEDLPIDECIKALPTKGSRILYQDIVEVMNAAARNGNNGASGRRRRVSTRPKSTGRNSNR
ncbi:hypothetical protein ABK040_003251 [Willaertia magna]